MFTRITCILILALAYPSMAWSAEPSDSVSVRFRQSKSRLELGLEGNGERLNDLVGRISSREHEDSTLTVKSVKVIGGASPEGSVEINRVLSHNRANRIYDWLSERVEIQDSIVDFHYLGRDWAGLMRLVEADPDVPYRSQVLDFLEGVVSSQSEKDPQGDDVLSDFKLIGNGVPYRYLYANLFPELRESSVVIDYGFKILPVIHYPGVSDPNIQTVVDVPSIGLPSFYLPSLSIGKECHPFYMALKTNLLTDALALPNIGAEFYVGKNWSVGANWTYGWWDNDRKHRYWRAYGGDVVVRRWFGKKAAGKPLTGHHIGLYAGIVTYDFEFGGTGYMGGIPGGTLWDRCNYVAGVEYGYSLPVARRLNIDFTLGIGYAGGKYIKYDPKNGYYQWKSTNRLTWIGPTKAEISLVWLIGCDNYNRGKGGHK